ncbi:MAG: class II glutamine amidotransferase [Acidobacteriota bacterium]|nr:class II glutamine amidotransferase [Acidobacteriota bacterium]
MCRFVLYLGPEILMSTLVTLPRNSIVHQSFHAEMRSEPLNGDGFGLAWYASNITPRPALFKSVSPAWSNMNLRSLARVTHSSCILAHVRAATPGLTVFRENCHPFSYGPFSFMHNGSIGGFPRIKREIQNHLSDESFKVILGSTDSEHLFALALDCLTPEGVDPPARRLADALAGAIRIVEMLRHNAGETEISYLNLVLTDGTSAAATRYVSDPLDNTAASLFSHTGRQYVCEDGVCKMVAADLEDGAVLVASEPLSDDEGWDLVPPNHIVLVHPDRTISWEPLDLDFS